MFSFCFDIKRTKANSAEDSFDALTRLVIFNAKERYGDNFSCAILDRIYFELQIIQKLGCSDLFLFLKDLVIFLQRNSHIIVARGSIVGSIIAYCLHITEIDPLQYDLMFETYLYPELTSFPSVAFNVDENFDINTIQTITSSFNIIDNDYNNHRYEIDFYGFKGLCITKKCTQAIKNKHGITIDLTKIPNDDEQTFRLICDADTSDVFLLDSYDAKHYLKYLQPHCLKELSAFIALQAPVLIDYIPDFIHRKQETSSIKYDIPEMEKYLRDTYGLVVYQEQIKLLSRELASFTRSESNTLLKVLGRMQITRKNDFKLKFLKQGQENGHDAEILEKIWNYWESIAPYVSSKSHVTSLTLLAYQSAYLKAHYPEEYNQLFNN